ncbi:uncharacterized protein LOC128983269 [Macrosteles quadrilineatus]|uniref:uncharacterized protein LOC128983269 n=1 Tax=Macrosteles quadrilineatus TaxID=74068 RepID=UPI0023E236BF|nr:uncharacterized protein LOC128983269 [Macrosteles quadrilineatus]
MVHKQHVIIDKEVQSPRKAEDNNLYSYSLPTPELLPKVNPNPIPMQRFKKSSSASIQRLIDENAMVHKQPVIIDKEVQAPRKAKQNNLNSYPLSTPELLPRVNPNPSPMQRFKKSSSASMQKLSDEKAMVHKHVITTENEVQSPRKILKKNENCNSLPTPELLQRVNLKSIPMQKFRKSSSVSIQKLSDEKAMVHKHVITTEKEVQSPRKILKKNENCNSLPTPELLQMVKQNPCPVQDFNKSLPASTKNLSDVELTKEPRITEVKEIQSIDSQILRNRESFPAAEDADESDEDCLSIFVDDKLLSPPVETEYSSHSLDGEIIPQRINTEFKKDKAFDGVGGSKLTDDSKRERTTSTESAKTATSYIHWTPNLVYDAGNWVKANTSMTSIMSGAEASFKSESPEIQNSSSTVYLPNFYAEHKDAIENDQEATSLETVTQKDDKVDDRKVSNNYISQITLDKIVPKGDKVKVEETVLRTVVNKSNNEWATYKERNQTEERNIQAQIHVPANQTEKATKIIQPLFTTVLKSIVDIVKIANELECFSLRVILKAVLVLLHKFSSEHTEENPTAAWMHKAVYNVTLPNKRSPFVHPKIQALLLLLHMIIDKFTNEKNAEEKRKFVEEGLYFMELAFLDTILEFRQSKAIFWLTIGMIYTILARHYGFLARVRKLMYDMFYCFTRRSLVVAHAMLLLWPSVLPPKPIEFYSDDPLRLCIIRQLTCPPKFNQVGPNVHIRNLQRFMMTKYRYKEDTVDPEKLFNLCMEHLEQQGVYKAAVLMIKRQPPEWFLGRPYKELLDKVRSWWKGGEECSDVEAVNAVNILCTALRPQDILCPKVQTELRRTLSLLEDILLDEWTPIWMQEVIVKNICLLTRLNHVECLKTIVKWKPSEVSEDVVDHIHHDVINKQTKEWWTSAVGSSFLRPS